MCHELLTKCILLADKCFPAAGELDMQLRVVFDADVVLFTVFETCQCEIRMKPVPLTLLACTGQGSLA